MIVRFLERRDGDESRLPMHHTAFGDHRFREISNRTGVAAQDGHFEATVGIQMDVHRCDLKTMMRVVGIGQSLRQFAGLMIVDVGKGGDARTGDATVDARLFES